MENGLSQQHVTVELCMDDRVALVQLCRPSKSNAFNKQMWDEFPQVFKALERVPQLRTVVLCGQGKNFCAGIDISYLQEIFPQNNGACPGEEREQLRENILRLQDAISCVEKCKWPVIAAVQGACVGAGVDLITACDMRFCSADAYFSVKEVDIAITADLGTLQRLPAIVGHGVAMDLALTARRVSSEEAVQLRLVSKCFATHHELMREVMLVAQQMAEKPFLALKGTKKMLLHARDNAVDASLDYVATWNSAMLISDDLKSIVSRFQPPRARL